MDYLPISVPILTYHSISEKASRLFQEFTVSPDLLAKQLSFLFEEGYTTITIAEFTSAIRDHTFSLPEKSIILTFDDGYADFLNEALPLLQKFRMTATLFIATAFIGKTSAWLVREGEATRRMLDWEQLREIRSYGIECGAHSHTHPKLDSLGKEAAYEEIHRSKSILEDHLGCQIASFAYPYGYYSATTRLLVRKAGFSSACAVKYGFSSTADDPFAISRLLVRSQSPVDQFRQLLDQSDFYPELALRRVRSQVWRFLRRSVFTLVKVARQEEI